MIYLRKNLFLMVFAFILSSNILSHAEVTSGQSAPNFALTDTNGKNHSLSDFQGKFVVLEWTNHDCPFVRKHYDSQNMQNLQKTYTGKGVVWLTINSSAPGKQGNFPAETWNELTKTKGASPTAVLLDTDGKVGKLYGAQTTPHMYIIDPKGTLLYQGAIDSTPSTDSEDISKSKNYVKDALDEAMNGKPVTASSTKAYGCSVKY
jgi:peroxiredoxin